MSTHLPLLQLVAKRRLLYLLIKLALLSTILLIFFYLILSHFISIPTLPFPKCNSQQHDCDLANSTNIPLESQLSKQENLFTNITIAITICGNTSLAQGFNALKSAVILTNLHIHFVIMTDQDMFDPLTEKLNVMKMKKNIFSYEMHLIEYPNKNTSGIWRKLFKECASERLFLPGILKHIDSVLYIDTDILFLSSVEEIWFHFGQMKSNQLAGMSYENEDFSNNWYHRFAKHPYYGNYGLNSGVMLMNLTRMRKFGWNDKLESILLKYQSKIVWGDQDIINIIFHYNPEKLYLFGCNWNYRPDHCVYTSVCKPAEKEGIKLVHGNRGSFLNDKQIVFRDLFTAFREYDIEQDTTKDLEERFNLISSSSRLLSNCGKVSHLFWKSIAQKSR